MLEQPGPTTSTSLPWNGPGFLCSHACMSRPSKASRSLQSGMKGSPSCLVATINCGALTSPSDVRTTQPPSWRSIRSTWTPSCRSTPPSRRMASRWSISWSRVGNIGVPLGKGLSGRCDNGRQVLRRSRS